jgi:hypothetical protein
MVAEAEKAALRKKLEATAKDVAAGKKARTDLEDVREEIEELEDAEAPQEKRFMTNDATIEKTAEILQHNPDGILYYRDELMGLLRSLEKAGREADRAFFLEAWNGNGSFSVDRIGRGSLHVPALCVSILGGIQPGPLLTYVHDAREESERADGLLQRFQVLVWPDIRGYDPVDRRPDAEARNRAYGAFDGLADLDAEAFGAHADEDGEVPYVRFTREAQEVFDSWRSEFEPRFRGEAGEYPAAIEAHFMKYRSLFASLALIFEVMDFVDGKSRGHAGGEESAHRARAWCGYLESHAMRVYHPILTSPVKAAEGLLGRIEAGDVAHGMKIRDLHRKGWQDLSTPDDARRAIDVLAEHGWVRKVTVKADGPGRPSEQLHLHPALRR